MAAIKGYKLTVRVELERKDTDYRTSDVASYETELTVPPTSLDALGSVHADALFSLLKRPLGLAIKQELDAQAPQIVPTTDQCVLDILGDEPKREPMGANL